MKVQFVRLFLKPPVVVLAHLDNSVASWRCVLWPFVPWPFVSVAFCLEAFCLWPFVRWPFVPWPFVCTPSSVGEIFHMPESSYKRVLIPMCVNCRDPVHFPWSVGGRVSILPWSVVDSTWAAADENSTYQRKSESWRLQLRYHFTADCIQSGAVLHRHRHLTVYGALSEYIIFYQL